MEQLKAMVAVFAIVGALTVFSAAANASAQSCLCERETLEVLEFKVWVPGPNTFIAGPGAGTTDVTKSAYGSFAVFDSPMSDVPDIKNGKELGRCRGHFLVDGLNGRNLLTLFTCDFTSEKFNGSLLAAGSVDYSGETVALPVLGGTGDFASAQGFVTNTATVQPVGLDFLDTVMILDWRVTVPKSLAHLDSRKF